MTPPVKPKAVTEPTCNHKRSHFKTVYGYTRPDMRLGGKKGHTQGVSAFQARLRGLVTRSGLTVRQIAEKSGISNFSMVLGGHRTPPLEKFPALADALGVTDEDERQAFYTLALLAHCPESMEPMLFNLIERVEAAHRKLNTTDHTYKAVLADKSDRELLQQQIDQLKAENDQLRAENAALKKDKRKHS